jgi:polyisoprenoid-binding protein YceI
MMVTWVRGHFKTIRGHCAFDPDSCAHGGVEATIDPASLWTDEPDRDPHLRNADFLDVDAYPTITFTSTESKLVAGNEGTLTGELTIRGVTRPVTLEVRYLGSWGTPFGDTRADFTAQLASTATTLG